MNILMISQASIEALLEKEGQHTMLSFLPLSHTFERTCGYYVEMMCNITVAYARSIQQLAEDLQAIKPTILISVPRIFERVYERIHAQLKKQSLIHRLLFKLAISVGWRRFEATQGRRLRTPILLLWPLLNRLVASKVQAKLGGSLYLAVSGGAALPAPVARTFIGLGLNVIQGYGMTETSPVLTANRVTENQPTSVGKALPGVELRIGDNEELLAKSPGVMLGYWNNHRATSETITTDGWLHTGDKAVIKDDFVYITGRIKDILVMSNGEKIPPAAMESAIALEPLFDQALLIGEGRPYLSALVVLNSEEWFPLARQHSLDPFEEKSLADRRLHSSLLKNISEALHDFPGYAKVRRVTPLLDAWTVDNDLLTPTLKVKRAKVLTRHSNLIEQMYAD
jgi:long-chain acyl-CoA synthetase